MKNIDYIQTRRNDEFHRLNNLDLQELLVQVQNQKLEYRDSLELPGDIEFQIAIQHNVENEREVELNYKWDSKRIWSASTKYALLSPIAKNTKEFWEELQQTCDILKKKYTYAHPNSAGHIKIGAATLYKDMEAWRVFVKLNAIYENVLYRFGYGEKINAREDILKDAKPIAKMLYRILPQINNAEKIQDLRLVLPKANDTAIDFNELCYNWPGISLEQNHLKIKSPNGTFEEVIWQNNINAYAKMLDSARNKVINEEFLDYKLQRKPIPEALYDSIHMQDALEFVDLVFDNNLDKIYFLRQYLKDFKEAFGMEKTIQAPSFIKRREKTYGKR